MNVYILSL